MKIIIGLGNPGKEYEATRHNIGWMVLDKFCELLGGCDWQKKDKFFSFAAEVRLGEERVLLVRPQTFMNNSGEAAAALVNFYKVRADDVWLVYDDLDLPLGSLRLRKGGSGGGHKGVESVIAALGAEALPRFRVGVAGGRRELSEASAYVLQKFEKEEVKTIEYEVERAAKAIEYALLNNFEAAIREYGS